MRKIVCIGVAMQMICGCHSMRSSKLHKVEWLTGTWEMKTEKGNIYESWKKINKYELSGKSYMLRGKDTVVFETLRLVEEKDSLFYIPTVKQQNNGMPVRFTMQSISKNAFRFEHPAHDFPQFIFYQRVGKDSLVAGISGMQRGRERVERFPMRKIVY